MPEGAQDSNTAEAKESSTYALDRKRSRSMGVLVGILAVLVVFSFGWYFLRPLATVAQPEESSSEAVEETSEELVAADEPLYLLLVGSDTRRGTALYTGSDREAGQAAEYADIITLVRLDPVGKVLTFVSVPRDTLVAPDTKINSYLSHDDPADLIRQVELLTRVKVPYYVMTTFAGYIALVDSIDGVDFAVPREVTVTNPLSGRDLTVPQGRGRLSGEEALVVARARKGYGKDQEALRQTNVRALEQAMIDRVTGKSHAGVEESIDALWEHTTTNIDHALLSWLVFDFVQNKDSYTVYSGTGPYAGQTVGEGLWAVPTDLEAWARVMEAVEAGKDPAAVIEPPMFGEQTADDDEESSA